MLKLKAKDQKNGFSLDELRDPNKKIVIGLFDDIEKKSQRKDHRKKFTLKIQNYYLGNVTIPLAQLFENQK